MRLTAQKSFLYGHTERLVSSNNPRCVNNIFFGKTNRIIVASQILRNNTLCGIQHLLVWHFDKYWIFCFRERFFNKRNLPFYAVGLFHVLKNFQVLFQKRNKFIFVFSLKDDNKDFIILSFEATSPEKIKTGFNIFRRYKQRALKMKFFCFHFIQSFNVNNRVICSFTITLNNFTVKTKLDKMVFSESC